MRKSFKLALPVAAVCLSLGVLAAAPSQAQSAIEASEALTARAAQIVQLMNDEIEPAQLFMPSRMNESNASQVKEQLKKLREAHGRAVNVTAIEPESPHIGLVKITFERGERAYRVAVEPEAPHWVMAMMPAN